MKIFAITPVPKPRMTRSDAWRKRPTVVAYWHFKNKLNFLADQQGYKITATLDVIFYLPMPPSWSKKKRVQMLGLPHQQTPDADNLMKAFKDCLAGIEGDGFVYDERSRKFWADEGKIVVFEAPIVELNHVPQPQTILQPE